VTKKTLQYEIVISGKNDNYTGYSYTTFNLDTFNIVGVKEIKVVHKDSKVFFDDEYWVLNKSKVEPPKGVRQINSMRLTVQDTTMQLNGNFFTTLTREHHRRVSGTVKLQKKRNRKDSELMHILDSLGISKTLAFYEDEPPAEVKKPDTVAVVTPPPPPPPPVVVQELPPPPLLLGNNEIRTVASITPKPVSKRQPRSLVSLVKQMDVEVVVEDKPAPPPPVVKKEPVVIKPTPKKDTVAIVKPAPPQPTPAPKEEHKEQIEGLAKRTVEIIKTVDVFADSIKLDLYDNGYVDGDSISIIVNGKVVLEHQLLSTRPITKWLYLTPDLGDEIRIIMYAENLGSIAPNTGLLSVSDGPTRYDILFSGDLKQNASIILRRKKK
jgi:hypothetical protein